jgi:glyoxylase-like metal-dependent hydrolase (beta-lactamase superfamily II)/rhodanese-related sulfurtransferase
MILKQYYLGCLSHASYLIGDEESKIAAIVDPQRDINQYLEDADLHGLSIRHVLLTHFHADFVAGHLELRDRVSASIYLGAQAKAEYEFTPLNDGNIIEFGKVRLKILETPGHSPESISILVYDLTKDINDPYAILTGDTLFIGDVGRPDLRASLGWSAAELGSMLYDSIHNKIINLPDETLVYPTHGAGSMCGKSLSRETVSTMGIQKKYNYALQPMNKEEFIKIVTLDQPEAPDYFTYDAILNTKERLTLVETMKKTLNPLSLEEVMKLKEQSAQILDVRDPIDFEGAHLDGSINIGLGGNYATWAGTILERDKPIVIIAEPGSEEEAVIRLGRIGFDHIAGYLEGGMKTLLTRPDLMKRTERITALSLSQKLSEKNPPLIIDVRNKSEWKLNRIDKSINIPLNQIKERVNKIPKDKELVVYCASGYRSSIALSLVEKQNLSNISDLVGGISAWQAAKLQTVN